MPLQIRFKTVLYRLKCKVVGWEYPKVGETLPDSLGCPKIQYDKLATVFRIITETIIFMRPVLFAEGIFGGNLRLRPAVEESRFSEPRP